MNPLSRRDVLRGGLQVLGAASLSSTCLPALAKSAPRITATELSSTKGPGSLTLLQGAFSHNAMAVLVRPGQPGAFANVVGRPTGPIVMTHTHNDEACTFWYAIASRLSRDMTKAIGDKDDAFGSMGANGAQKLNPEMLAQDVSDQNFRPVAGKVNRFLADSYVVKTDTLGAHNNVTNPTVGRLVASVLDTPAA